MPDATKDEVPGARGADDRRGTGARGARHRPGRPPGGAVRYARRDADDPARLATTGPRSCPACCWRSARSSTAPASPSAWTPCSTDDFFCSRGPRVGASASSRSCSARSRRRRSGSSPIRSPQWNCLDLGHPVARVGQRRLPPLGRDDELGPAVLRVRLPFEVAEALLRSFTSSEVAARLSWARAASSVSRAPPGVDVAEDLQVGLAQVGQVAGRPRPVRTSRRGTGAAGGPGAARWRARSAGRSLDVGFTGRIILRRPKLWLPK